MEVLVQALQSGVDAASAVRHALRQNTSLQGTDETHAALGVTAGSANESLTIFQDALLIWPGSAALQHQLACRLVAHYAERRAPGAIVDAASLFAAAAGIDETGRAVVAHGASRLHATLVQMQPDWPVLLPTLLNDGIEECNWRDYEHLVSAALRTLRGFDWQLRVPLLHLYYYPFAAGFAGPALLRAHSHAAARLLAAAACHPTHMGRAAPAVIGGRLRLSYVGADWREHVTLRLLLQVLVLHDRRRVTVDCFALNAERSPSPLRRAAAAACDRFVDLSAEHDGMAAARLAADAQLVLDVNFRKTGRPARSGVVVGCRPPLLVSLLAHPGSSGSTHHYVVTDRASTAPSAARWFAERLALLPHHYQPNSHAAQNAAQNAAHPVAPSRASAGLPSRSAVLAYSGSPAKLTPQTLQLAVGSLAAAGSTRLWLVGYPLAPQDSSQSPGHAAAQRDARLVAELAACGLSSRRVQIGRLLPAANHLARAGLADAHIDSLPYNAHSTAVDVSFATVPHLTLSGETMHSRVAAALIAAIGLPQGSHASLRAVEDTVRSVLSSRSGYMSLGDHTPLAKGVTSETASKLQIPLWPYAD